MHRAAKMCHELEHARQYEAHGDPLLQLYDAVNAALDLKVRGLVEAASSQLDPDPGGCECGCGPLRGEPLPRGRRSASPFTHEASNLLRSLTGLGQLRTLPGRTVAFAYEYADLGEQFFRERNFSTTFGEAIDQVWPGAADAWRTLEALTRSNGLFVRVRTLARRAAADIAVRSTSSCQAVMVLSSPENRTVPWGAGLLIDDRSVIVYALLQNRSSAGLPAL